MGIPRVTGGYTQNEGSQVVIQFDEPVTAEQLEAIVALVKLGPSSLDPAQEAANLQEVLDYLEATGWSDPERRVVAPITMIRDRLKAAVN